MFRNLKIITKLTLIFVLLITVSILIIGYIGFHIAEKSLKSARIAELKSIADLKVDKIESFFYERKADIKIAQGYYNIKTNLPIVTQFANDRTNHTYMAAKKMLDGQLKTFQIVSGYSDIMLVSPEGKIVYVTNEAHAEADLDYPLPDPDGKAFEKGKEGTYFSGVFFRIGNKMEESDFTMLVTAPVHDFGGKFIGLIVLEVDMEPIYEFIQDTTGLGETGETLIGLNKDDHALFLNPLRHDAEAALKRKAIFGKTDAFPIQEAVRGRKGSGLSIDYRGKKIIAAWRHIPSLDWGLVAKIDTSEAFTPVKNLRNISIIILITVIIVIITISILLSARITKPIRKLVKGTERIAKGDLTFKIETMAKDEIGLLITSFNDMTSQLGESRKLLQDYALNLEKKVEDKTKKLHKKAKELEKVNKELEEFIYIVSHDLKEPMFTIDGFASRLSIICKDQIDDKGKSYIDRIRANIKMMSQKVYEIMEVLKMGRINYDYKDIDSGIIVRDVVEMSESKIKDKEINVIIQDKLPTVLCDGKRIRDVFSNLVTNAIKFIDNRNGNYIKVGCDKDEDYYRFFVEDTGIGIKEEYHDQVFKLFRRLKDIEVEGTGVGLAIVKKIVEIHNGKIWVESPLKDGRGTRFCFTLPVNNGG